MPAERCVARCFLLCVAQNNDLAMFSEKKGAGTAAILAFPVFYV
jgi:hypothetical protein